MQDRRATQGFAIGRGLVAERVALGDHMREGDAAKFLWPQDAGEQHEVSNGRASRASD